MKVIGIFQADMRSMSRLILIYFLVFLFIEVACVVSFWAEAEIREVSFSRFSIGDNLIGLFNGMDRIESFEFLSRYKLPIPWILAILSFLCFPAILMSKSMNGYGILSLVACGRRSSWWYSKCILAVFISALLWMTLMVVCLFLTSIAGGSLNICIGAEALRVLGIPIKDSVGLSIASFSAMVLFVMLALSLMELSLSLIFKPIVAFVITAGYVIASLFIDSNFFIGNLLMSIRSAPFCEGDFLLSNGSVIAFFIIVVSIFGGKIYFDRCDLLEWESD